MHRSLALLAACAATFVLAACNSEPETVTVNQYDPQAGALANAAPVELPPAITASRTYRCRDNSLVYIDFYNNNTARIRAERGAEPVATATSPDGTAPYTADGYSVSGSGEEITYAAPGRASQSCHT
ncbi:hypothetical protein RCO27_18640 [Sphingosinicella sp. LHD-64]|uniref:hypothetical protein n=1 Tax=Sphingosinicella sp. LHD-64 TaxID=3072139 RepID=UPI00280D2776|nr:hypothetical protein [Sphingosinicella sp. LHD-64]MDQ8758251.1 hypothetical protein [Sphingosinicella sp. LHD-64]